MRDAEYFAAVYGILEDEQGKILLMQRKNTWYMDWKYGLPAWHLEWEETLKQGTIREIREEICIDVAEKDLEFIHSSHRIMLWGRVYFDFYFRFQNFSWKISNWEEHKCSKIDFISPDDENIIPYLREVFQKIENGERFSEIYINS